MAHRALGLNGLEFDPVRAGDVKNGCLEGRPFLFVPGGWASNKIKSLGEDGVSEVRKFVEGGGGYLGICGGAGLATADGIGLLNIKRRPTKERVPSFSGRIELELSEHEIWEGRSRGVFHAWWPSQFIADDPEIKVAARYGAALADSFSSDINTADAESCGGWRELEESYGINLDPARLKGEPAVVEGKFGEGRVLLSLVHFDTPWDEAGAEVLRKLWRYLGGNISPVRSEKTREDAVAAFPFSLSSTQKSLSYAPHKTTGVLELMESEAEALMESGIRNFLWFRRNPMLIQWRRGVRGLEYCTLYVMTREIVRLAKGAAGEEFSRYEAEINSVYPLLEEFSRKAQRLLVMERRAMQSANITYERCNDPEIERLRLELFSKSKSHGGMFKDLIDLLDKILYPLIAAETCRT